MNPSKFTINVILDKLNSLDNEIRYYQRSINRINERDDLYGLDYVSECTDKITIKLHTQYLYLCKLKENILNSKVDIIIYNEENKNEMESAKVYLQDCLIID